MDAELPASALQQADFNTACLRRTWLHKSASSRLIRAIE
jgi:hypothetical protein